MFQCVFPLDVTLNSLNWTLIETLINPKILLQFRILNFESTPLCTRTAI